MRVTIALLAVTGVCAPLANAQLSDRDIAALYSRASPFESIPRERWIAESENAFAVRDKSPQAPVHLLVISKKRVPTVLQAPEALLGEMLVLARRAAEQEGIAREGFRLVVNTHPQGGQSVYHLHIHVLGGRQMKWPPG
jgi:histidine triad (HIT) family protein